MGKLLAHISTAMLTRPTQQLESFSSRLAFIRLV